MKTSETINEIAEAMAKAQGAMKPAAKDSTNPHFKSKYADIASIWEAIRAPLASNGLAVWQDVENHGEGIGVTTRIVHSSGQWVEFGPLVVRAPKDDAHGVGSATAYAKKYALAASVGAVADGDDDGNAAVAGVERERSDDGPDRTALSFHDLRLAIEEAAKELEQRGGGLWPEHVRKASEFKGDDGKPKSFSDPYNARLGEKWLKGTLGHLRDALAASESGAADAGELFT